MYTGWKISDKSKGILLQRFPPKYSVVCDYITERFGIKEPQLPDTVEVFVIGYASNNVVEALVVKVDGKVVRPDGGIFHITLSVNKDLGGKPVHSNELLRHGWYGVPEHIKIDTKPIFV